MNPVSKFTPKVRREKNSDPSNKNEAVQVFCRIKPLKNDEESTCIKILTPRTLALTSPLEFKGIRKEIQCQFRHIFSSFSSQVEVFEHVAYPLLDELLKGNNGLLFTYGVTGSGKTYTLSGDHSNPGIMPKCIYTIFNTISGHQSPKYIIKPDKMNGFEVQSQEEAMQDQLNTLRSASKITLKSATKKRKDKTYINDGVKIIDIKEDSLYAVFISYVEIYNNTVYDLLDENTGKFIQGKLLREDGQKNMYVSGAVEVEVKSPEEAFELFNIGQKRKRMGSTLLNSESSRSHSIFNIRVVQFQQIVHNDDGLPVVPDSNLLKISQLSLVDLAGSERTNRTQNTGQMLREASSINNSLLCLRTCLDVLRENQLTGSNKLVPYRDNRLTLLFKNYFEGGGRVEMIVCVNPSVADFEENLQVMKFAETTQDVKVPRPDNKYNTPAKKTIYKKVATPISAKVRELFAIEPKIPELKLNFASLEASQIGLESLCNVLRVRCQKVEALDVEFEKRAEHFRNRLLEVQQENVLRKSEQKSLKALLKKEKQRRSNVESKLADMEVRYSDLNHKIRDYQNEITSLKETVAEKDLKINKKILEREKTKQKMVLQGEKMTQELDAKLRRQREHLQAVVKAKDNKLQKVRDLLEKEITPPNIEQAVEVPEYNPQQTPRQDTRRNMVAAARQRRSRSAGDEVWLEHNAVKPVPLGTVMQPTMKKRKSVTKLSKASEITKQGKYCLIAQETDKAGDLETKLYKADIVQTCGGGAQVIFNDVETLRQDSPTADKS